MGALALGGALLSVGSLLHEARPGGVAPWWQESKRKWKQARPLRLPLSTALHHFRHILLARARPTASPVQGGRHRALLMGGAEGHIVKGGRQGGVGTEGIFEPHRGLCDWNSGDFYAGTSSSRHVAGDGDCVRVLPCRLGVSALDAGVWSPHRSGHRATCQFSTSAGNGNGARMLSASAGIPLGAAEGLLSRHLAVCSCEANASPRAELRRIAGLSQL